MDNLTIDLVAEGDESLAKAIEIMWAAAAGSKASHYIIKNFKEVTDYYPPLEKYPETGMKHYTHLVEDPNGTPTLILLWSADREATALPFPLRLEGAINFVKGWLQSVDYGPEPGHDGSNGKGWRIFTEAWGHVAGSHYAIFAVQPAWAMYGK